MKVLVKSIVIALN